MITKQVKQVEKNKLKLSKNYGVATGVKGSGKSYIHTEMFSYIPKIL